MNNVKYATLREFLKQKVADPALFTKSVSLAAAIAIARKAPLPSAAPESPTRCYLEQAQAQIERQVAEFNEEIVIDLELANETARAIWLMRCGLCYPKTFIEFPDDAVAGGWLAGLSNAGFSLGAATYEYLNANASALFVMANRITSVMNGEAAE